jgi:predicted permease
LLSRFPNLASNVLKTSSRALTKESETTMQAMAKDLSFALRQCRRSPGFSLTAVLSLALGIGATVCIFSVIYDALLHPYPYAGPERICQVRIFGQNDRDQFGELHHITGAQIQELRRVYGVEDVIGISRSNQMVTGNDLPEGVDVASVTGTSFRFLGIPAMLGRCFGPSDAPDGNDPEPVAVLGYKFWQRHFNGDPNVVGKTIQLDHQSYAILGVLPPRYRWMDVDVYLPLKLTQDLKFGFLLKIKPNSSISIVAAEIAPLYLQFQKEDPNGFPKKFTIHITNILQGYAWALGRTLYLLFAAVVLLLAIACANVSILLLARGAARQHEMAVRSAMGATRVRIIRQLLTEALILAIAGAGIGTLLTYMTIGPIVTWLPKFSFAPEAEFRINLPILLFSVGLALATGLLFGLFPALELARLPLNRAIQGGTHKLAGGTQGKRMHLVLIAGQIALTLVLLTTAGTAIAGFTRMMRRPLGFDPHQVMSIGIPIHEDTFSTWAQRATYFELLRERISELPGVVSTAISSNATPPNNGAVLPFDIQGETALDQQEAHVNLVSPEYFATLHISLIDGRLWNSNEVERGATLALVNQTFVHRYFPDGRALGRSIRFSQLANKPPALLGSLGSDSWLEVIGIAGDAVDDGLDKPVAPAVYLPYTLLMWQNTQFLVRAQSEPLAMINTIRHRIAAINPDQQISRVEDLETLITRQPEWEKGRLISILFGAFSSLALILAAVGLYSVMSYGVAQRQGEFGIRMALGARRSDVFRIVLLSATSSVALGLALGIVLCFGLSRFVAGWVENGSHNSAMVAEVSLLMIMVAALACLIPARRAVSVDPTTALRRE